MPTTNRSYYIGRVKRAPHRGDAYLYASIEPLCRIRSDRQPMARPSSRSNVLLPEAWSRALA